MTDDKKHTQKQPQKSEPAAVLPDAFFQPTQFSFALTKILAALAGNHSVEFESKTLEVLEQIPATELERIHEDAVFDPEATSESELLDAHKSRIIAYIGKKHATPAGAREARERREWRKYYDRKKGR